MSQKWQPPTKIWGSKERKPSLNTSWSFHGAWICNVFGGPSSYLLTFGLFKNKSFDNLHILPDFLDLRLFKICSLKVILQPYGFFFWQSAPETEAIEVEVVSRWAPTSYKWSHWCNCTGKVHFQFDGTLKSLVKAGIAKKQAKILGLGSSPKHHLPGAFCSEDFG